MRWPSQFHTPILALVCAVVALCAGSAEAVSENILHDFSSQQRGAWPNAVLSDSSGNLFGVTEFGGAYNSGAVFEFAPATGGGWTETVLYSFTGGADGSAPLSLMLDAAGNIYGVTGFGGLGSCDGGCGTAFKLAQNSGGRWVESTIYSFQASDGYATGALLLDTSGTLYGAVSNYADASFSVFQLTPSGGNWTENILYSFSSDVFNTSIPGLAVDGAGNLYGTLTSSLSASEGLVFELTPSSFSGSGKSWKETTLFSFLGGPAGGVPTGNLLLHDGQLFGTTLDGGEARCENQNGGCGVAFELTQGSSGWSEKVIYTFQGFQSDGPIFPSLSAFDGSGNLYGFTGAGGAGFCPYCGSVFELVPNEGGTWTESDLWDFAAQSDGAFPTAVTLGLTGQLYGVNLGPDDVFPVQGQIFELDPGSGDTWKLTPLYTFPLTDGQSPFAGLVSDAAGDFFGTTQFGGSNNVGSIFEVSPAKNGWKESVIYSFGPAAGLFFSVGPSGLVGDGKGNFYGTTEFGGVDHAGSVFELSRLAGGGWQEKDLFSFHGGKQAGPMGNVVFDNSGNIYGVTFEGGAYDLGTVFELIQTGNGTWQATVIYSFRGYPDASNPVAGLTVDPAGNLYGTTVHGGNGECRLGPQTVGCGTVFKLSYAAGTGWTESVLHSFAGERNSDGASPLASVILDGLGNLYGTTFAGGILNPDCPGFGFGAGCGTVFELSPAGSGWNETILYEFRGGGADGAGPGGALVWDGSGNFYGTLQDEAAFHNGALFKLTPASGDWSESLIHAFGPESDGRVPVGALIFGASGNLYGVTASGGVSGSDSNNGQGTVFEIKQ